MDDIILSEVGVTEFVTYFSKLSRPQKIAFAKAHYEEILALKNADIFAYLCGGGFFNYLAALFETGDEEQKCEAFVRFYGKARVIWLCPPRKSLESVVIAAAKKMELMRFLREETDFFQGYNRNSIYLRRLVYENASPECLDYLFFWVIRNNVSVSRISGLQLFARASANVIRRYISKIAFFSGSYSGICFQHIKALYDREDLSHEVKMELIFSTVNHFRVSEQVITQMRKAGMFNG